MARLKVHEGLGEIPAQAWDGLHEGDNPFLCHAFLSGLENTGCLRPRWGWVPRHATLWRGNELVAAAPAYLKANSHGEFVFDHAWARAYAEHGLDYYPKWLVAVPYSPVTGPRLLARDAADRRALAEAMRDQARGEGLSSLHVNFHDEVESPAFDGHWLAREDVQYHWRQRGWPDFEAFLAALEPKKRKNIRQEREKVRRAGFRFRVVHGDEATPGDLEAMHGFYLRTFADYGNHPALTLDFFRHLAATMPRRLLLVLAERGDGPEAGALFLRGDTRLYGRYWGAASARPPPGLHFETCYYQGIEYCLREGLSVFEPGAQGEHKIARGFLPAITRSHHWVAHPAFAEALQAWCAEEVRHARGFARRLMGHSPYRELPADPAPAG